MISAVIVTYNSEKVLGDCLKSVKKADELVILDLGSKDQTLKIAKDYQAKIFHHRKVEFVEEVRNFAVNKAGGDWILVLDPDERIGENLWGKLLDIIKEGKNQAVNIPRKNIFFGKWIAHTNWWPDYHVRFFKKGTVYWSNKIHYYPTVKGGIYKLSASEDLSIVHFGYDNINQFIDRQNRYSDIEARNLFDEGVRFSWFNFFLKPTREFFVRYIKHLGFLDGYYGFALSYFMVVYRLMVEVKLWELGQKR